MISVSLVTCPRVPGRGPHMASPHQRPGPGHRRTVATLRIMGLTSPVIIADSFHQNVPMITLCVDILKDPQSGLCIV